MTPTRRSSIRLAAITAGLLIVSGAAPAVTAAADDNHQRDRGFRQTNLVSNIAGM